MVPGAGIEPARYCYRGILSPLRLPISPPGQCICHLKCKNNYSRIWLNKKAFKKKALEFDGARGRNRTGTVLLPRDFKSLASTYFATRAAQSALLLERERTI